MDQTEAQAQLDAWIAASLALASSQAYSIGGRSLTRADGAEIRSQIAYWSRVVDGYTLRAAGGRTGGTSIAVVPT